MRAILHRTVSAVVLAGLLMMSVLTTAAEGSWLGDRTGVHINMRRPLEPKVKVDWHHPRVKSDDALIATFVVAGVIVAACGGIQVITVGPVLAAP